MRKIPTSMYFENTWKCADNYTIVDFNRFDASNHRPFYAMKDETILT